MRQSLSFKTSLLAFGCIGTVPVCAQPGFDYLSSIPGAASNAIEYHDGYLYSGEGNTLSIYDVRQGTLPPYERLYRRRFLSFIDDLLIEDNLLFVCANTDGLYVFDISTPVPEFVSSWHPESLDEAVYDVAIMGDTLFIANKTRLTVLKRNGSTFNRIKDISILTHSQSRLRGCAVKEGVLAFTVATMSVFPSALDGVYLYDARTLTQIAFWSETYGDAEDVLFGEKTSLLHVMGGGQFTSSLPFPFGDPRGHYYILDIALPAAPVDVYHDTIAGISGLGDTQVLDAHLRNDTIYLATRTGDDMVAPVNGNVFIYDVRHRDSITFLTDIDVGLLHFDVTLQGPLMHVASEWYGIRTIDISDIFQPLDRGDTRTGGWCSGTDIHGDLMLQANEGYATQLFDISDRNNPELIGIHDNVNAGFNYNARFSADGNYIYACYIEGLTLDEFRVLETATMQEVGSLNFYVGYEDCFVHEDRLVAYAIRVIGSSYISLVDVSDPFSPQMVATKTMKVEDMELTENGLLWVCRTDSLIVYDISTAFVLKDALAAGGDAFRRIAHHGDTVVICRDSRLQSFTFNAGSQSIQQLNAFDAFVQGIPTHMAMDNRAIYAGYTDQGLFAFDRNSGTELGYYRTGLDFIFPEWWRLEDVQVYDDLVVLTEYFGQTTLLTFGDTISATADTENSEEFFIYPNPVSDVLYIYAPDDHPFVVTLIDISGYRVARFFSGDGKAEIPLNRAAGMYVVQIEQEGRIVQCGKVVVPE